MNTAIQTYPFQSYKLRVISDDQGMPWFIAKDICQILGYENHARTIGDLCRKDSIRKRYIPELSNNYTLIDEGNLYRLIIKSNKPEAQKFESWVCDEILPSIRKNGGYLSKIKSNLSIAEFENLHLGLQNAMHDLHSATITMSAAELLSFKFKNPPFRDAIISLVREGKTRKEIAKITGATSNNVRQAIYLAKKSGELKGTEGLL